MKIYLTRHGETEWNKAGRMQGWQNSNLTERGIENAEKLGASLNNVNFHRIYCSPLGRAIETANCIRGDRDIEIMTHDLLKEMGFGLWEGMEFSKIEELYPTQKYNFWNKPHLYEPVEGESFDELICRARMVLDEVINNNDCENVLIVSHAALIKAIYITINNHPIENFWAPPFINDTSLTIFEIKDKEIEIILEADISHLD